MRNMKFTDLSWAAVLFYYRSSGDRKYCKIMSDKDLRDAMRSDPLSIPERDFEQRVILDYINTSNYDILYKCHMSRNILDILAENRITVNSLARVNILDCNLSDAIIVQDIMRLYEGLLGVEGLWATGASKILHILNSDLFPPINQSIIDHFEIYSQQNSYVSWLRIVQKNGLDVVDDFRKTNDSEDVSDFLSRRLRYDKLCCRKSIVKYIDEYYRLTVEDKLPVPPSWVPENKSEQASLALNN